MTLPKVSVIVPVYNCRASVEATLRSVFDQTLGSGTIEVIAVDDGSTDGSGDELDRIAESHAGLTVLRRPNSGGPGAPRNAAIDRARGEYLFFLDADDRLGPEALERLCAMADENGTDVVIGNYVGVGRGVARFEENVPRVTVDDPDFDVYGRSLTAHKLFRRDLVERHGIRFPEGILSGEDKVFTGHALLCSSGVSIVADYDCYYLVEREDGTSIMQAGGAAPAEYYAKAARPLLEQVMAHTKPGMVRDRMLVRHFQRDVLHRLNGAFLAASADDRRATRDGVRTLCEDFLTPAVLMRMPPRYRLLAHCARSGHQELLGKIVEAGLADEPVPVKVDGDRAYALYPGFREAGAAIPDAYFDVTDRLRVTRSLTALAWDGDRLRVGGTVAIDRVGTGDRTVAILLRDKKSGAEHRVPCEPSGGGNSDGDGGDGDDHGGAGFTVAIDPATAASGKPLPAGAWDLHAEVTHDRLAKEGRLGADRDPEIAAPPARFVVSGDGPGAAVTPFFTRGYGNLTLTVTPGPGALEKLLRVEEIGWDGGARLRIRGHVPVSPGAAERVGVAVRLKARSGGDTKDAEVETVPGEGLLEFTAVADLRGLAAGRWDVHLEFTVGEEAVRMRVPIAAAPKAPAVPCAPLGLRRASFYRTGGGNLAVHIVHGRVPAIARSAGRRLTRR
ncbi:glycosyltransferase family 2 protein [Actinomadura graeca]|uniref:Glycosyltransferase family 2 protein n=1 Tax=Actinomadura graeca TaxID=2750812 RepID=A0ABX8QZ43_9ACTN|nr:glycosyltransferase family 2 protein [Actinomadura graeca]QXJ22043.1 glycosyltransferase family 2 protein [Actinomadura graeca]